MRWGLLLLVSIFVFSGCSQASNKATAKEPAQPLVQIIDNTQLAKVILRPKQKELVISRDPFKPIMTKNIGLIPEEDDISSNGPGGQSAAEDVILIGVVKLGNDFRALMKSNNKSGVYKTGDKIGAYIIQSIDIDKVILLTPDDQRVIKSRGKK